MKIALCAFRRAANGQNSIERIVIDGSAEDGFLLTISLNAGRSEYPRNRKYDRIKVYIQNWSLDLNAVCRKCARLKGFSRTDLLTLFTLIEQNTGCIRFIDIRGKVWHQTKGESIIQLFNRFFLVEEKMGDRRLPSSGYYPFDVYGVECSTAAKKMNWAEATAWMLKET